MADLALGDDAERPRGARPSPACAPARPGGRLRRDRPAARRIVPRPRAGRPARDPTPQWPRCRTGAHADAGHHSGFTTIRAWDRLAVYVPRHGFCSVDDYYASESAGPAAAPRSALPTLIVAATGDPMVPAATVARTSRDLPSHVSARWVAGGHVGFRARASTSAWATRRAWSPRSGLVAPPVSDYARGALASAVSPAQSLPWPVRAPIRADCRGRPASAASAAKAHARTGPKDRSSACPVGRLSPISPSPSPSARSRRLVDPGASSSSIGSGRWRRARPGACSRSSGPRRSPAPDLLAPHLPRDRSQRTASGHPTCSPPTCRPPPARRRCGRPTCSPPPAARRQAAGVRRAPPPAPSAQCPACSLPRWWPCTCVGTANPGAGASCRRASHLSPGPDPRYMSGVLRGVARPRRARPARRRRRRPGVPQDDGRPLRRAHVPARPRLHERAPAPGMLKTPVDRCPRCRGMWLDGDERHALARSSTRARPGGPVGAAWPSAA